jgi:hypothetical protein
MNTKGNGDAGFNACPKRRFEYSWKAHLVSSPLTFLMNSLNLLALLSISILFGCATGMPAHPVPLDRSRTFNAPFDTVWPTIISYVAEKNLTISTLEKASGIIAINDATYSPADAEEGVRGSTLGTPDVVLKRSAKFNIFATSPSKDKTNARVNLSMKMYIRTGNGSRMFPFQYWWADAYSNGNIESSVFDYIAYRIGNSSFTNENASVTGQAQVEKKTEPDPINPQQPENLKNISIKEREIVILPSKESALGYNVYTLNGEYLGQVMTILNYGGIEHYIVKEEGRQKTYDVSATEDSFKEIDPKSKKMVVIKWKAIREKGF